MTEPFILSTAGNDRVLRLTLNRPQKRNALTRKMLADLHAKLVEAATTSELRCLVLAAAGPAFCAGMDLAQMQEASSGSDARQMALADAQLYHDVLEALLALQIPTVAVVQGPALAGGVGLVLTIAIYVFQQTNLTHLDAQWASLIVFVLSTLSAYIVPPSANDAPVSS